MKAKLQLIGLFAIFFVPVLVAFVLNINPEIWKPTATVNHGELLQPPIKLESFTIIMDDGSIIKPEDMASYWVLFGLCNDNSSCQVEADKLERLRLMAGRHASRIKTLTLHPYEIKTEVEGYVVGSLTQQLADLAHGEAPGATWIIDPRGYLMMHYEAGFTPADLKKDMDRLLKYNEQDKVSFENE